MATDIHNGCPACPEPVQKIYAAAELVLALLDQYGDAGVPIGQWDRAIQELRAGRQQLVPFIDAHFGNQDHALSPELERARHPVDPASLVLDRALPFQESRRG